MDDSAPITASSEQAEQTNKTIRPSTLKATGFNQYEGDIKDWPYWDRRYNRDALPPQAHSLSVNLFRRNL
ncbi:hypothetical protein [Turicimonas muris]|uniref:hypothetical protein n=1 Tax=Turicimonas muris TaxID=1796652 RepID=UPI003F67206D